MFFNNLSFVWLFFPATLLGFYLVVPRDGRRHFLLAVSLIFYALSGLAHLLLLICDILWVYAITRSASYPGSTQRMWLAIAIPLAALVHFKYLTFILEQVIGIPPGLLQDTMFARVLLPIGISFFTFELISYSLDRYRGEIESPAPLIDLALFVTFFPHLVAGPILRYRNVATQFSALPSFRLTPGETQEAIVQICLGFFVKILLADWISGYVSVLKGDLGGLSAPGALYLVFGFSFQIYFDFFGYSLIAIGVGRLLGVRLPDNFQRPYDSLNPREFWRRWHISLSFWLRDYLYFPLGGNKRYIRNIIIVFLACGIWHGAGWNFAFWGLTHALLVIGYHHTAPWWDRLPPSIQRGATFTLVSFAWLPFLFDMQQINQVLGSFAVWTPQSQLPIEAWGSLAAAAGVYAVADADRIVDLLRKRTSHQVIGGIVAGVAAVSCLLFLDRTATFIYFRF